MRLLVVDFQNTQAAEASGMFGDNWLVQFTQWLKKEFPHIEEISRLTARKSDGAKPTVAEAMKLALTIKNAEVIFLCDSRTQKDMLRYCAGKKVLNLPSPFFFGSEGGKELFLVRNKILNFFEEMERVDDKANCKNFG